MDQEIKGYRSLEGRVGQGVTNYCWKPCLELHRHVVAGLDQREDPRSDVYDYQMYPATFKPGELDWGRGVMERKVGSRFSRIGVIHSSRLRSRLCCHDTAQPWYCTYYVRIE